MTKLFESIGWMFGTFVMRPALFIQKITYYFCLTVLILLLVAMILQIDKTANRVNIKIS